MDSKTLKSIRNFILLILVAWFVKTAILEIYVVPTGSMFDTIEKNDIVIGNKFIYGLRTPNWVGIPFSRSGSYIPHYRFSEFKKVENGDITVFEFPYDDMHKYVKRTIGLPKQYIEIKQGKISIGQSLNSIVYKEDLTYPEKSRIKKEITSQPNDSPTEKDLISFILNRYPDNFSYYQSVVVEPPNGKYDNGETIIDANENGQWDADEKFVDGREFFDRDNLKFQVPYKGMNLNLSDPNVDLFSALKILLLDGYDISLKGYSIDDLGSLYNYNNDSTLINYNKIEDTKSYQFHKLDNEQMFDTSMTIWGFVLSIPTIVVIFIVMGILWKIIKVIREGLRHKFSVKQVSQLSLFGLLLLFIAYMLTIDLGKMYEEKAENLIASVNNDLSNNKISLIDFFEYKLNKERLSFSDKDNRLNSDYNHFKNEFNSSLARLGGFQKGLDVDLELLYNLDFDLINTYGTDILDKKSYNTLIFFQIMFSDKTDVHTKYGVNDEIRYAAIQTLVDYYNYKNMYDYNVNYQINKKLKQELFDYILVDGTPVSEKSDYVLQHNYYFMVGDNRNGSSDSRSWGFVPDYNLLGQPVITLVNFGKFKLKFDVHL